MKTSILSAAIVAAMCCAPALRAQTSDFSNDAPRQLDRVTVIGTPPALLPGNVRELHAADLETKRAATHDTAQLLQSIPGVSVQAAGGISALPIVHGLAGDRNRVQIDGMDFIASCPNHMNPPLSYIDPAKVETIRVYAGISPVSAGGDSIGGSIQVQSKPPRFAEEGQAWQAAGDIAANYRSNGNARGASLAATLASDTFHLGYAGSVAHADNYRAADDFRSFTASGRANHAIDKDEVGSSAYLSRTHQLTTAWRRDTHLLQADFGWQDVPYQLYPNQRMDMLGNTQRRVQMAYEGRFGDSTLQARVWSERVRHEMDFGADKQFWYGMQSTPPNGQDGTVPCAPIGPNCAAGMPMLTQSRTNAASVTWTSIQREANALRIGAEWQGYRLDDWWPPSGGMMWAGDFWNIRNGQRNRASIFAEWEGRVTPRWSTLLGARYTHLTTNADSVRGYDIDPAPPGSYMATAADAAAFNARQRERVDHHLDITALLRFSPSKQFDWEIGYAHKTRSPNLYERYAWSTWTMAAVMNNFVGGGNGYVGNIGLKPEKAHTVAMTFDWHAAGEQPEWRLRATPWLTRIDDYIDATALTHNGTQAFNVLRYTNQSAQSHGMDFSAETALGHGHWGEFGVKAIASWMQGSNRDTRHGLYNQMPPNAQLTLTHRHGGWNNSIEWLVVDAKTHVSSVRNEIKTPGYGLLHLRSGYQTERWEVNFGVENALNKSYALPTGGVYIGQGRTMGINAIPYGIAVPGMGRSYYVAFKFSY